MHLCGRHYRQTDVFAEQGASIDVIEKCKTRPPTGRAREQGRGGGRVLSSGRRTDGQLVARLCRLCSTRVNTSSAHGGRGDELTAEKAPWDHRVPTSDAWSKRVWRPCLFTANDAVKLASCENSVVRRRCVNCCGLNSVVTASVCAYVQTKRLLMSISPRVICNCDCLYYPSVHFEPSSSVSSYTDALSSIGYYTPSTAALTDLTHCRIPYEFG